MNSWFLTSVVGFWLKHFFSFFFILCYFVWLYNKINKIVLLVGNIQDFEKHSGSDIHHVYFMIIATHTNHKWSHSSYQRLRFLVVLLLLTLWTWCCQLLWFIVYFNIFSVFLKESNSEEISKISLLKSIWKPVIKTFILVQ